MSKSSSDIGSSVELEKSNHSLAVTSPSPFASSMLNIISGSMSSSSSPMSSIFSIMLTNSEKFRPLELSSSNISIIIESPFQSSSVIPSPDWFIMSAHSLAVTSPSSFASNMSNIICGSKSSSSDSTEITKPL